MPDRTPSICLTIKYGRFHRWSARYVSRRLTRPRPRLDRFLRPVKPRTRPRREVFPWYHPAVFRAECPVFLSIDRDIHQDIHQDILLDIGMDKTGGR